jgi:hypothetical protein
MTDPFETGGVSASELGCAKQSASVVTVAAITVLRRLVVNVLRRRPPIMRGLPFDIRAGGS